VQNWKTWALIGGIVLVVGFGAHWLSKSVGGQLGASNVKFSIWNFLAIGVMAGAFIWVAKLATAKWPIPGLTPVVQML